MIKVLLFSATWCAPCKALKDVATASGLDVEVIDIETDPDRAATYGVRGVPTLVRIVDGETVAVRNGANMTALTFKKWATE